ncbi:hypothetical protein M0802_006521 [Mischocyttarus mexicanus]|nr:hypothetical protein M0802_006521 [Mischocyttarus mexicanus]
MESKGDASGGSGSGSGSGSGGGGRVDGCSRSKLGFRTVLVGVVATKCELRGSLHRPRLDVDEIVPWDTTSGRPVSIPVLVAYFPLSVMPLLLDCTSSTNFQKGIKKIIKMVTP